jgi:hypothetical protein
MLDYLAKRNAYDLHDQVFKERNTGLTKDIHHSDYSSSLSEAHKRAEEDILNGDASHFVNHSRLKTLRSYK